MSFRYAITAATVVASLLVAGSASATVSIPVDPDPPPTSRKQVEIRKAIVRLATQELNKGVAERRGDNVPRYRNGKGAIAPYSIRDAWCVAFGTWVWKKAGIEAYLGTGFLRTAFGGDRVAVQVRDLSNWARRNGHWTYGARPGDLIAYGTRHLGVVTGVNRKGRAVWSIEGNQSDRVTKVKIPMTEVVGYISPFRLSAAARVTRSSASADID